MAKDICDTRQDWADKAMKYWPHHAMYTRGASERYLLITDFLEYNAITNSGCHPTFGQTYESLEDLRAEALDELSRYYPRAVIDLNDGHLIEFKLEMLLVSTTQNWVDRCRQDA